MTAVRDLPFDATVYLWSGQAAPFPMLSEFVPIDAHRSLRWGRLNAPAGPLAAGCYLLAGSGFTGVVVHAADGSWRADSERSVRRVGPELGLFEWTDDAAQAAHRRSGARRP